MNMKQFASKFSFFWSLFTFIGIVSLITGIILLSQGDKLPFLGLNSLSYFLVASFCLPVGISFAFPLASNDTKDFMWKLRYIWGLLLLVSFVGGLYSVYLSVSESPQPVMGFEWNQLGILFVAFTFIFQLLLLFSMESGTSNLKEQISNLGTIWLILALIGFVLGAIGTYMVYLYIGYWFPVPGTLASAEPPLRWESMYLAAALLGGIAIPWLAITENQTAKAFARKTSVLGALAAGLGLVIILYASISYIMTSGGYLGGDISPIINFPNYFDFMAIMGLLLLFYGLGLCLPHISVKFQDIFLKTQIVWGILAVVSALFAVIGVLTLSNMMGSLQNVTLKNVPLLYSVLWISNTNFVDGFRLVMLSSVLLVMFSAVTMRIIYTEIGGADVLAARSLADLESLEEETFDEDTETGEASDTEKRALITIKKESTRYTLGLLKSSYRRKEIEKGTYARWYKNMSKKVVEYNQQLDTLVKKTKFADQQRVFDEVLKEKSESKDKRLKAKKEKKGKEEKPKEEKKPKAKVEKKPKIIPEEEPEEEEATPPPAVAPPPTISPPPVKASSPPPTVAPPPMTAPKPPTPPSQVDITAPVAKKATSAVGTARSTSIAELRGEMLKELQRLKDIFDEDEEEG